MVDIIKTKDTRISGDFLYELRSHRSTNFNSWKDRVGKLDALYRGDWDVVFPNEQAQKLAPSIMNLVQVGLDDIARITAEAVPTIKCHPASNKEDAQTNAYVREAIANTYWYFNSGEILVPRLAMDLAGAGAAFIVVDTEAGTYPKYHRVDPRMAFPDVHNGNLQDLLVVQNIKLRQAARLFPRLNLNEVGPEIADSVEVMEYYSADECVQAVGYSKDGHPVPYHSERPVEITKRWEPDIGMVPVAFAQLDSFDGEFRGMFDQIAGSLQSKNRIVKLMLDYTDRMTYAPKVSKGLLNEEEVDGPNAHYRLDPNVQDARVERVSPAGSSPQLFGLLEFLDREHRGGTSYPAARQGQITQSIASAAFVASTQGQLTSTVRNIQRLVAAVRERLNVISYALDERHLDIEKALSASVGKKKTYTPGKDIGGVYGNKVIYGAGAGLDRLNADARINQHLQLGLISKETSREQLDYLDEKQEEEAKIEREAAANALAQKFLGEAPWQVVAEVVAEMENGKGLAAAIKVVQQKGEQQTPQPLQTPEAPGGQGALSPPVPPPPQGEPAQDTREAFQKGRVPRGNEGQEGRPPQFRGPPLRNVVRGRRR